MTKSETYRRPVGCPYIYTDGVSIFLEYPSTCASVLKFPLTEGGMHKALKIIPRIGAAKGQVTGATNFPAPRKIPQGQRKETKPKAKRFSDSALSAMGSLLRKKMGGVS